MRPSFPSPACSHHHPTSLRLQRSIFHFLSILCLLRSSQARWNVGKVAPFDKRGNEAQRGEGACPGSHSQAEPGPRPRAPDCWVGALGLSSQPCPPLTGPSLCLLTHVRKCSALRNLCRGAETVRTARGRHPFSALLVLSPGYLGPGGNRGGPRRETEAQSPGT